MPAPHTAIVPLCHICLSRAFVNYDLCTRGFDRWCCERAHNNTSDFHFFQTQQPTGANTMQASELEVNKTYHYLITSTGVKEKHVYLGKTGSTYYFRKPNGEILNTDNSQVVAYYSKPCAAIKPLSKKVGKEITIAELANKMEEIRIALDVHRGADMETVSLAAAS